jgi:hypothetical protein
MPLRVVWHQVVRVFRPRITRERRSKLPSLDLTGGGGASALTGPMERHLPWQALTHEW